MISPDSRDELVEVIRQAKENNVVLRVYGGTFPATIKESDVEVKVSNIRKLISCDPETQKVKVESGMNLSDLVDALKSVNLMLELSGQLPLMSVLDAISLGLIGSNVSIADIVESCQVIQPNGLVEDFFWDNQEPTCVSPASSSSMEDKRGGGCDPSLSTMVCGLGLGGVISTATIKCVPLHTMLENNQEHNFEEFLGLWEHLAQIHYIHAQWFALIDTFLVTSAFPMRLHLSFCQPMVDKTVECVWRGISWLMSSLRSWLAWYFPCSARWMSRAHYYCVCKTVAQRTNYCFQAQQFISTRSHCRGVKWVLPFEKCSKILGTLRHWVHLYPHLCSSPAVINIQHHQEGRIPLLSPYCSKDTFTIWVDWFHNTSTYFSPELAEFEALLQENGGRKCWSVGPVSISPLIGNMYPGFRQWRANKLLLDKRGLLQSAYVEGEFVLNKS